MNRRAFGLRAIAGAAALLFGWKAKPAKAAGNGYARTKAFESGVTSSFGTTAGNSGFVRAQWWETSTVSAAGNGELIYKGNLLHKKVFERDLGEAHKTEFHEAAFVDGECTGHWIDGEKVDVVPDNMIISMGERAFIEEREGRERASAQFRKAYEDMGLPGHRLTSGV